MVQMKVGLDLVFITQNPKLYIPHGSDESPLPASQKIAHGGTFISHMVQMKETFRFLCKP